MRYPMIAMLVVVALAGCREQPVPKTSSPEPAEPRTEAAPPSFGVVSYAEIVERARSGVVTIRAARRVRPPRQHPFFDNPRLRDFFGDMFGARPSQAPLHAALGSGVIVQSDGTILTSHHVIDGAEQIQVELANHRTFDARIVGQDPPSDLAVLKINAGELAALPLGDSDRVRVGDVALAIGNPLGIGQTVTAGIVSAKGRSTGLSDGSFEDFLQTDAPINQGNSGGALINTRGELIGINSQILSTSGGSIGIGFAIPSNMARQVMDQLIKTGKVSRGRLGVAVQPLTPELAAKLGLKEPRGVVVASVAPDSPAARAGIRRGDVMVAFNGDPVTEGNSLRNRVAGTPPQTKVEFTILRDKRKREVEVTLEEYRPAEQTG